MSRNKLKTLGGPALLLTGGALIGAVAAGAFTANAAEAPTPAGSPSAAPPRDGGGGHPAETPLTGTTKSKVEAAVLAKYPGAKIERTETDSDGVYESHITTASGQHITVEVNDTEVTLRGRVRSLAERYEAEKAAWSAPGVTAVHNEIGVRADTEAYTST